MRFEIHGVWEKAHDQSCNVPVNVCRTLLAKNVNIRQRLEMRNLGETFTTQSSALFILVRKATPDKVLAELKGFGGRVLKTSLTTTEEEELQKVLRHS